MKERVCMTKKCPLRHKDNKTGEVELVQEWIKKHDMCGSKAWWDGQTYYNLTAEQIVQIATFLKKRRSRHENV